MTEIAITSKLQGVRQVARNCPNQTLQFAYLRAAREFCKQTRWLRRNVEGLTEADVSQYTLGSDELLEVVGIRAISCFKNSPRQAWNLRPIDTTRWPPNLTPGAPAAYAYVPEGQFVVHRTPDAVYTLTITVECVPKEDAPTLPLELLTKWDKALEDGALDYLLNLPDQPWSNPNLAAQRYTRNFNAAINNARADVQRAFNTGTTPPRIRRAF